MSVERIIFLRHGQTDYNLQARIQGASNFPLNARGIEQAREIAPHIAQLKPTKIISSDLVRALDTAQIVGEQLGITPITDTRLRERNYGLWEGLTSAEIKAQWPQQWQTWRDGDQPLDVGVETRADCGARVVAAVEAAVATAHDRDTLLFVAHGGAIVNGVISLLGLNPSQWAGMQGLDNCHWALLVPRVGAQPAWRLRSYNRILPNTDELENSWR